MPRTIPSVFESAVEAVPAKPWLHHEDAVFTYAEAHERIAAAAAALAMLGVGRGDLVLATARNAPEYLFTWLATMYLGAILVPANPNSAPAELAALIEQVRPRLVVADGGPDAVPVDSLFATPA